MKKTATLEQIAALVDGQIVGDPTVVITGIASLEEAKEAELTFLAEIKNIHRLEKTKASAAIVPFALNSFSKPIIRTKNPYLAYAKIQTFFVKKPYSPRGIDPRAFIGKNVQMGKEVSIYPFVFIGDGCQIEDRVTLYPGVYLGESVRIGSESILFPNVVVLDGCQIGSRVTLHPGTVIGSDGFGFAQDGEKFVKIPQIGIVQIDDEVEIGANCTIDRAAMGKTWIKRGVKTDNLVQIGHNVIVGEDSILVAQVGIAGSTEVGDRVILGGQVGVVGHIKIGDGAKVGAQSGVAQDVAPGKVLSGSPAFPHRDWLRAQTVLQKLPEMKRTVDALEKKMRNLEENNPNRTKENNL
jgi:UDP-3-O-[3-hydroxymyristoyl] glucosamine N-acyltransferase